MNFTLYIFIFTDTHYIVICMRVSKILQYLKYCLLLNCWLTCHIYMYYIYIYLFKCILLILHSTYLCFIRSSYFCSPPENQDPILQASDLDQAAASVFFCYRSTLIFGGEQDGTHRAVRGRLRDFLINLVNFKGFSTKFPNKNSMLQVNPKI